MISQPPVNSQTGIGKRRKIRSGMKKNLPINPDNMNELAVALSKSILSMKKLAESADIEILTEDKEQ